MLDIALPLMSTMDLWSIQSMESMGLRQYRLKYRVLPHVRMDSSVGDRKGDRMENPKDRLPRDLYINEPELKFNTAGRAKPVMRIVLFRSAFLRGDDAIYPS
jgi:hypothetical protein